MDESPQTGKISLGLSTIVRVTIRDGTFHEDIGYGHIENCKGKAAAFEKAKKEAATDAMKRALRNFGNVLGNCLYDKDYLSKVQKIKVQPSRWDADRNLHRHPDFAPVKQEVQQGNAKGEVEQLGQPRAASLNSNASYGSIEFDDDFGGNSLDETDFSHPDEVRLDDTTMQTPRRPLRPPQIGAPQRQGVPRIQSMPQLRAPNVQQPAPIQAPQPVQRVQTPARPPNNAVQGPPNNMPPPQQPINQGQPLAAAPQQTDGAGGKVNSSSGTAEPDQPAGLSHIPPQAHLQQSNADPSAPRMPPGNAAGFVTARSADSLNAPAGARPTTGPLPFNPNAEATSIRRTHGVNPGKSAPVMRQSLQQQNQAAANGTAFQPHQPQQQPVQRPQSPAHPATGLNGATTPIRTNFVNPSADANRRIGMPPPAGGMQNRGGYRAPMAINGGGPNGMKRPPLSDVSNLQQAEGAGDAKKAKLDQPVGNAVQEGAQQSGITTAVGSQ